MQLSAPSFPKQAIVLTSARRHTSKAPIPPASLAYLLTLGGMAAANVLAYLAGGRARAAYVRCLEATAAIMRLQLFGLAFGGAGWELTRCVGLAARWQHSTA